MALGIISRTCTSPGLIESTRVTKKFSPDFHFNLSQKQLARQATNKRRKPKVTPARLHHGKLRLKLHALRKRNTYLQSQSSHSSSAPVLPCEPTAVTIKQLRKDTTLSAHFSEEIEWLGSPSSESEDEGDKQKSSHGARGKDKVKSMKTAKLTSQVPAPQRWPDSHMSLLYVNKDRNYDELTLAEFITGYASILQLQTISENEQAAHNDHLAVLMYLVTQFSWASVRGFYAAVLLRIECGRVHWSDSFTHLESRLLQPKPAGNNSSS